MRQNITAGFPLDIMPGYLHNAVNPSINLGIQARCAKAMLPHVHILIIRTVWLLQRIQIQFLNEVAQILQFRYIRLGEPSALRITIFP